MGARANGLGYASSCIQDEWSLFNNVAGLTKVKNVTAAFTYDARPALSSFNRMASIFTMPSKLGVIGIGVYKFGDNLYNEQILTAGFANSFGIASLGIKVNYVQYRAEGFGRADALTISFGGIASLSSKLSVGAHIVNINQPNLSNQPKETLPTVLIVGLGFKPTDKLFFTSELEKDLDYDLLWKTGIEYNFNKKFTARTGFHTHPEAGFFGIGVKPKKFNLDYAFQYNLIIGASHQATVAYRFQSK